jgi:predicted MFS family arabinose efflux permease
VICAGAGTVGWLVFGRVLQGCGAALLMPNSLAILGASFDGEARGRAVGIWAAVGAAAGAVAPLIGGELIAIAGWRSIFLINLPLAALALWLGQRSLDDQAVRPAQPLDLAGAALASAGLGSLTWGLTVASAAAAVSAQAALAIGLGLLGLVLFVLVERRAGDNAMLPLQLFASRAFVGLNLLTFLLYGALGVLLVGVPFVLIEAAGYSATAAGAALLPVPVVIALGSSAMGRLAAGIGPRLPLTAGPVVVGAGFFMAMRIGPGGDYWTATLPALLLIAFGMAGAVAPLTTAVLGSVDAGHTGVASGFNSAVARAGGLIATALLGLVLAARGAQLIAAFHLAVLGAGVASLAAGLCAFLWLERR